MRMTSMYAQADGVRKEIVRLLSFLNKPQSGGYFTCSPYANGRERGFVFSARWYGEYARNGRDTFRDQHVYVAECRGSDQIIAITSYGWEYCYVTEDEYKARKFFDRGAYRKTALFVLKTLLPKALYRQMVTAAIS